MKLYQLLWTLLKHGLHGRFRDEVYIAIDIENERRQLSTSAPITGFTWESRPDAFCIIEGATTEEPHSEDPPLIESLIEASSLGTPEAKALRELVPDDVVQRIIDRAAEIGAEERAQFAEVDSILARYDAYEFTEAEAVAQLCRVMPSCIPDGARSLLRPRPAAS